MPMGICTDTGVVVQNGIDVKVGVGD